MRSRSPRWWRRNCSAERHSPGLGPLALSGAPISELGLGCVRLPGLGVYSASGAWAFVFSRFWGRSRLLKFGALAVAEVRGALGPQKLWAGASTLCAMLPFPECQRVGTLLPSNSALSPHSLSVREQETPGLGTQCELSVFRAPSCSLTGNNPTSSELELDMIAERERLSH